MKNNFRARTKFEHWVREYGGTLALSQKLGCDQSAVQHWLAGRAAPRLTFARKILKLSDGKLSLADVFERSLRK